VSKSRGVPLRLTASDVERFWQHVIVTDTCAIWAGACGGDAYGRFALRDNGRQRTVTPHQVAAVLAWGPLAAGATVLHDCDIRLCVRTGPGHVRVASQAENMRHAVQRGRARRPRPGFVDERGEVGLTRAIQDAMRASPDRSSAGLARVLRDVVAAGDPLRHQLRLFDASEGQLSGSVSSSAPLAAASS
jgi:hypothetical protein